MRARRTRALSPGCVHAAMSASPLRTMRGKPLARTPLDRAMVIEGIRLLEKSGGHSGDWRAG